MILKMTENLRKRTQVTEIDHNINPQAPASPGATCSRSSFSIWLGFGFCKTTEKCALDFTFETKPRIFEADLLF